MSVSPAAAAETARMKTNFTSQEASTQTDPIDPTRPTNECAQLGCEQWPETGPLTFEQRQHLLMYHQYGR